MLYERIEAYLGGRLSASERKAFEQELAADQSLAADLELHRRLEQVVSDREKRAFRHKVADLAKEFPASATATGWRGVFRPGGLLLALLAVVVLWQYLRHEPAELEVVPSPPVAIQDTLIEAEPLPAPPEDAPAAETAPPAPTRQPFDPNPALEAELAQEKNAYYTVDGPTLQALSGSAAGRWRLSFAGLLLTAMAPPEFELLLLDNRLPAGQEQARLPVALTLIDEDSGIQAFAAKKAYRMLAEQELRLPKGLYYARLIQKGQTASLWTGRLEVK